MKFCIFSHIFTITLLFSLHLGASPINDIFNEIIKVDKNIIVRDSMDMTRIDVDDLKYIIRKLGDELDCAVVVNRVSSELPKIDRSTVSNEALWMLNGYLGGVYPPMKRNDEDYKKVKVKIYKWLAEKATD